MANEQLCTDCAHRNQCKVSSTYVKQCANYEFKKMMSPTSLCPTCKYQALCLEQDVDEEVLRCSKYKQL